MRLNGLVSVHGDALGKLLIMHLVYLWTIVYNSDCLYIHIED